MTFYPPPNKLPESLKTAEFQLLPLTPDHVEIDYQAVMSSREMLNLWSGSSWPTPDFTLAGNLDDLEWHQREHQERAAFTYTILDPTAGLCLGCLYIRPLSELTAANPALLDFIGARDALARFWVRASHLQTGLDRRILQALTGWFAGSWDFSGLYFQTRQANQQQIALFKSAGLAHRFDLQNPRRGGTHEFWN
jgi:hypothetical protein